MDFKSLDGKECNGERCPTDNNLLIWLGKDRVCIICGEIFHPLKTEKNED